MKVKVYIKGGVGLVHTEVLKYSTKGDCLSLFKKDGSVFNIFRNNIESFTVHPPKLNISNIIITTTDKSKMMNTGDILMHVDPSISKSRLVTELRALGFTLKTRRFGSETFKAWDCTLR